MYSPDSAGELMSRVEFLHAIGGHLLCLSSRDNYLEKEKYGFTKGPSGSSVASQKLDFS